MKKQFPIISFEHASFQYEGQSQESLKDVKLIIKSGEFLVITGQSGCGKTTLTRCINNLIPRFFEGRLSGEVIVLGRSIKESDAGEAGKEIASIFQDPRSQFFTTNSSSEVAFACENYGIPHKEIVKRVNSAFQSLNMENLKDRDIFALSSGERQKVAFLAATTLNPQIYVLDEPSANLDIHTILQVREILSALKAAGHTIIVSEHRLFYLYGLDSLAENCSLYSVQQLIDMGAVQLSTGDEIGKMAYGTGEIPFVRTSDFSNWEIKADAKQGISEEIYQQYAEKEDVQEGDILLVRDGTYLVGTSCMITALDTKMLYCGGLIKIRALKKEIVDEYLLLGLLNSYIVKRQIRTKQFTRDVIDTLGQRLKEVIIPIPNSEELKKAISEKVHTIVNNRIQARDIIQALSDRIVL